MKQFTVILLTFALTGVFSLYGQSGDSSNGITITTRSERGENPSFVRYTVPYSVQDSVDNFGNLYIRYSSFLPTVFTFVNSDGSVSVCSSDESAKVTYIYEFSTGFELQKTLRFENEFDKLGAFTKDNEGNYYVFYAQRVASKSLENMAMVKYNREGERVNVYRLRAGAPDSFDGIRIPFDAGTCRLELSGSMLAVYFAREMFNGHQASYGFVLDKNTFERIDRGAATNSNVNGGLLQIPYASHSFNQFILPINNGFIFVDHGDAYPRSFTFARFLSESNTKRIHAFSFPGQTGSNPTYAEMGGLAKTSTGYIFAGTYGANRNTARNLFILTFDENLATISAPVYLTKYTTSNGHPGHPKIVSLDNGRYLLLWEFFSFSTQTANTVSGVKTGYLSTFALAINEKGEAVSDMMELKDIRLNINDTLRYNPRDRKVYWTINDSGRSLTTYALDTSGFFN